MLQIPAQKKLLTSIKTRIAFTTLITVTLVLISVTSGLFVYFHNLLRESIFKQQFVMVSEIAEQLDGRIQLARHQLTLVASDIDKQVLADPQKLENVLTHGNIANLIFDAGMLVIGIDGRVIAESMDHSEIIGADLSLRDYVKEPLQNGKLFVSAPFRSILPPNNPMIAMVVPVRDNNDRIICLLAGYHTLGDNQFLTSLSSKGIGSTGYLYLLHDRTILMHPDGKRVLEQIPEGKNRGIDQALKGLEGSLDNANSQGKRMLSSFKKVGETGWILGANIPYDDAFSPLKKLAFTALLIATTGIVFSLLVLWYVTGRLTLPIRQLTAHVDAVRTKAKEWKPLELTTGDEIERLAGAFNIMMEEVHEGKRAMRDEKVFVENLINSASTPLFVIDHNHKVLYWNRALELITGVLANDVSGTGLHWSGFYRERRATMADLIIDNDSSLENLYTSYSSSKYIPGGFQAEGWYDIGGTHRYLVFEAAPIRDTAGRVIAAIETFEDITVQRKMEESLARLSRAVEQSPATIVITNLEGTIEYVNPKFCQVTGFTPEEAIGQNPRVLKSGEMTADNYASLWQTVASGQEWRGEFHNKRKDGSLFWEFASISPLFDKNGGIVGYLAVKEDITERKHVEAELAESRQELETKHKQLELLFKQVAQGKREWEETLDHLRDLVILTDAGHRIRRFNRLLAEITGLAICELTGLDWRELLKGEGFQCKNFNGVTGEILHERTGRNYDINIYSVVHEGVLEGHVISLNDTTDLRSTTHELQKAYAELKDAQLQIFQQEKMASIGQLAAGVAHEINNPMGFISSNLGTLSKYIDRLAEFIAAGDQVLMGGSDIDALAGLMATRRRLKVDYVMDDARQLIAESQDGAGRVRRIVQDLKSFSRVDQAESALINVNEALETTINIAWNEIKYVAELSRDFGEIPLIKCYPQQLNQVFLNLLVNAAHALGTTQGGITVRTRSEADNVFISVTDSGCGIPEENLKRIFEPFFTTKEVGKGTGLGLSISYEIIRKHGGEITVASELGAGSTFTVRLPVDGLPPVTDES